MQRRVSIAEFKARKRDEGGLDIEGEDGTLFSIPNPALWPDELMELARAGDNIGAARLVLGGDETYQRFVAAGGSAVLLMAMVKDELGASAGE